MNTLVITVILSKFGIIAPLVLAYRIRVGLKLPAQRALVARSLSATFAVSSCIDNPPHVSLRECQPFVPILSAFSPKLQQSFSNSSRGKFLSQVTGGAFTDWAITGDTPLCRGADAPKQDRRQHQSFICALFSPSSALLVTERRMQSSVLYTAHASVHIPNHQSVPCEKPRRGKGVVNLLLETFQGQGGSKNPPRWLSGCGRAQGRKFDSRPRWLSLSPGSCVSPVVVVVVNRRKQTLKLGAAAVRHSSAR